MIGKGCCTVKLALSSVSYCPELLVTFNFCSDWLKFLPSVNLVELGLYVAVVVTTWISQKLA